MITIILMISISIYYYYYYYYYYYIEVSTPTPIRIRIHLVKTKRTKLIEILTKPIEGKQSVIYSYTYTIANTINYTEKYITNQEQQSTLSQD